MPCLERRISTKTSILILFCCTLLFSLPCYAREEPKDSLDVRIPQSVTYIEFLARGCIISITHEPILFYDSTAFFGAGVRSGLQIGVGTNLLFPIYGIRFAVPLVPTIIIGKEYGFEIGAGLDFQWWLNKSGFESDNGINTYNSLKLTGVIGYRHYSFGFPHKLFRIGFTPTMQANGRFILSLHISFGI